VVHSVRCKSHDDLSHHSLSELLRPRALTVLGAVLCALPALAAEARATPGGLADQAPISVRFVDLNGDELLDKLISHESQLSVSINRGTGSFVPTNQQLPLVDIADILVSDLDGDGLADLYLVSPHENVALRGDGTGYFSEATAALGLADAGSGLSAERIALDNFGAEEVLLHNVEGDVLFWATGNGFERDGEAPQAADQEPSGEASLMALEQLVAGAAELLALDPGEELVLGLDAAGKPRVVLGSQRLAAGGIAGSQGALTGGSSLSAGSSVGTSGGTTGPGSVGGSTPPPAATALTTEEQEILDAMSIVMLDDGAGNLVNKTIRFTGVNVQVVNGLGATNGNTNNPQTINPNNTNVNGVGNVIVGYNELGNPLGDDRTGSHNLVLGQGNSHPSFGGLAAGRSNTISGVFSSVSGGEKNNAKARFGSISGGKSNTVKGVHTSASGGFFNTATGNFASISGGQSNKATGAAASVSGGSANLASGARSSISGGLANAASATNTWVSGGRDNTASSSYASVSGGRDNVASGSTSFIGGGRSHAASGSFSSITGGKGNFATASYSSVVGGQTNRATAQGATVSGGGSNMATGTFASVSGGFGNVAAGSSSAISGGYQNTVSAAGNNGSISGGAQNDVTALSGSVSGGSFNEAKASYGSVSGGQFRDAVAANNWVAGSLTENN